MKTHELHYPRRIVISLWTVLCLLLSAGLIQAQAPQPVYILTTLIKVEAANVAEFEKVMTENWKPAHQLRKQNGKITNWALYAVNFSGATNEYNYVSVAYFDSFNKTEPNDNWPEIMKAANPKGDANAILAKTTSLRKIMRQLIYSRIDGTTANPASKPIKYIVVNYMQPKNGMASEFSRLEREEWKPVHQALVDAGQRVRWTFWGLEIPGGTEMDHHYVTSDVYSSYDQMGAEDFTAALKKAKPGADAQSMIDRSSRSRDIVKRELWEMVLTLN